MSGIPGLVGATPIQNVGAYGQDVSETIISVRALDRRTGQIVTLTPPECGFSYRDSVFKSADAGTATSCSPSDIAWSAVARRPFATRMS